MSSSGLAAATERMREAGVSDLAIAVFADAYRALENNETGAKKQFLLCASGTAWMDL